MDIVTPKLKVPLQIQGKSAAVVEQDSDDEVVQCVIAILRTRIGTRPDDAEMGVPDFAFHQNGADLDVIRATLLKYEPRAKTLSDQEIEDLVATVSLEVATTTEGSNG